MFRRLIAAAFAALALTGAAHAEDWRKLLTPAELSALLEQDRAPRVLDIREPEGRESYALGHVPGAVNTPYADFRGPKENPGALISDAKLTGILRGAGLERDDAVVIVHNGHDDTDFGSAARVYWTLKSAGFEKLAILNGGYMAWASAGMPVSTETPTVARSSIEASISDRWLATRDDVKAAEDGSGAVLVDARPEAFFKGLKKHDAAKEPGTLFGAVNWVHDTWFAPKSPVVTVTDEVLSRARGLAEKADGHEIVSFCNTGHWAATNWFALSELAGVENVKLYPESTVGWSNAGLPLSPGG
jgi:thiosulfate/3-mercaptopyruvate sulfurtransferase